ncbi:MAG TPA: DUF3800 domain-containing protein [Sphingobium sp.]
MLVFIDESGDPGFKLDRGSTPVFAAAMVVFDTVEAALETENVIKEAMQELRAFPEFKFNKCDDDRRDAFFQRVSNCNFCVRAIIVRKDLIYSNRLRDEKEEFYRFFVKNMVKHDGGLLKDAKVIIDGSGERLFRQDLERHLKKHANGGIKSVKFADSRRDSLVQLADMAVGAIARSYRSDRKNADRWRKQLGKRLQNVWEFK